MFQFVAFIFFTWVNYVTAQSDAIVASLLEEVMSLRESMNEEITQLKLDVQELQLTSTDCTCSESSETSG